MAYIPFSDLIKEEGWELYFYLISAKQTRSHLEDTLLRAYQRLRPISICCCDLEPLKDCPETCCDQVQCSRCEGTIRICRDFYCVAGEDVLCYKCKNIS